MSQQGNTGKPQTQGMGWGNYQQNGNNNALTGALNIMNYKSEDDENKGKTGYFARLLGYGGKNTRKNKHTKKSHKKHNNKSHKKHNKKSHKKHNKSRKSRK